MKKIIPVFLILMLICGCSHKPKDTAPSNNASAIIIMPNDDTVNGYRKNANATEYRANTSTKKFHKPDCRYGKKISEDKLYTSHSREDMINKGYEPCKICEP